MGRRRRAANSRGVDRNVTIGDRGPTLGDRLRHRVAMLRKKGCGLIENEIQNKASLPLGSISFQGMQVEDSAFLKH